MAKNGNAQLKTITLEVKRIVTDLDFRRIFRYLETYSRTLHHGEAILILNRSLTRWRIIGPKSEDGGHIEFRGYAPRGQIYNLAKIETMVLEGLFVSMAVPEKDKAKLERLVESRKVAA